MQADAGRYSQSCRSCEKRSFKRTALFAFGEAVPVPRRGSVKGKVEREERKDLRVSRLLQDSLYGTIVCPNFLESTRHFSAIAFLKRCEVRGRARCPMPDAQRAPHVTEKGYKYQFKAGVVPSTGRTIAGLLVAFG